MKSKIEKRKPPEPAKPKPTWPEFVASDDLTEVARVTDRWLLQLSKNGWYPPKEKGKWQCVPTLVGLFEYYKQRATKSGLSAVREAREKEKLRSEKVRADEAEQRVMPLADFEDIVARMSNAVRTRLLAIPSGVAPYLIGLTDVAEIDARLRKMITDALSELSQPVTSTNTRRKHPRRK